MHIVIGDMCELKGKVLTDEEVACLEEAYEARPVAGHFWYVVECILSI